MWVYQNVPKRVTLETCLYIYRSNIQTILYIYLSSIVWLHTVYISQVGKSLAAIEGYIVNYTVLVSRDPLRRGPSRSVVVNNPYKFRVEVGDLHPATFYSVCVSAYSKDLTSRCSKIITKKTHESGTLICYDCSEIYFIHRKHNKSFIVLCWYRMQFYSR